MSPSRFGSSEVGKSATGSTHMRTRSSPGWWSMRKTSFAHWEASVEKSYSGGRPTPPSSSQPQFQEEVPQGEPRRSCSLLGSWVLKS